MRRRQHAFPHFRMRLFTKRKLADFLTRGSVFFSVESERTIHDEENPSLVRGVECLAPSAFRAGLAPVGTGTRHTRRTSCCRYRHANGPGSFNDELVPTGNNVPPQPSEYTNACKLTNYIFYEILKYMKQPSVEIALPGSLQRFVEQQVAQGRYSDPADYVREVLAQEQLRTARADVDAMLLEALNEPFADLSSTDFVAIRQRA